MQIVAPAWPRGGACSVVLVLCWQLSSACGSSDAAVTPIGHDAGRAEYVHVRDGVETRLLSKSTLDLEPGDVVSIRTCGGGGYGPPAEREPERVLRDVLEEKISARRAEEIYRVAVLDDAVDRERTEALRA